MKKTQIILMLAFAFLFSVGTISCKLKDGDIQKAVQTAIAANPDAVGVTVSVEKGVVTLAGEVKDEAVKIAVNGIAAGVKDVKSVVNDIAVAVPLTNPIDSALQAGLAEALKDYAGVNYSVLDGVITLTGEIRYEDLPTLMRKMSTLNPVKINNQLNVIRLPQVE